MIDVVEETIESETPTERENYWHTKKYRQNSARQVNFVTVATSLPAHFEPWRGVRKTNQLTVFDSIKKSVIKFYYDIDTVGLVCDLTRRNCFSFSFLSYFPGVWIRASISKGTRKNWHYQCVRFHYLKKKNFYCFSSFYFAHYWAEAEQCVLVSVSEWLCCWHRMDKSGLGEMNLTWISWVSLEKVDLIQRMIRTA